MTREGEQLLYNPETLDKAKWERLSKADQEELKQKLGETALKLKGIQV
ncbi:MAG: hypothetical protein LBS96_06455 [Oscillospiraceae bacterium]|nr:hypothetical protein [Oscillospiraceae bacterium]